MKKPSLPGRVIGLVLLAALVSSPAALAHTARSVHSSASLGTAVRIHRSHAHSAASTASPSPIKGVRRIPRTGVFAAPVTGPPTATSVGLSGATPLLGADFNGVSSLDSAVTNFGQEFEPPDQGLCVGNGFVLEMVNSAYTVYRPDGSVVTGPFNVNGPFDEGLKEFTSDPRCYFDPATHTWFAVILFINSAFDASRIDVAVNTSGDPTKLWNNYEFDTTDVGGSTGPKHPGCPCLGDQPTLGIDPFNLYITTNEFSLAGPEFNGGQIYAIAKKDLVNGSPTAHFVHFDKLNIGGSVATSIQPALTTGSPGAEYFLNSLDPSFTFDNRIGVWAMTERAKVASGGKPTLSSLVLPSETYGVPPAAQQKGSSSLLDSGDDRMQQTQFIKGSIWGELDTAVKVVGDSATRAGAAWFRVKPTLSGTTLGSATMQQQGYVALSGNYILYPAVQVAPSGKGVMVYSVSGTSRFPSAAYSLLPAGGSNFGPVNIAAAGTTNYDPNATRWGDYSWATLAPGGGSFWLATEYVPPTSSQTKDRVRDWGTRVFNVGG